MDNAQHLISLIQTVISLAPAIVLIWKMSGYAHQINKNKEDINNIGNKLNGIIEKSQAERTNTTNQIISLNNNVSQILTEFKYLKENIDDMKKDLRDIGKQNK